MRNPRGIQVGYTGCRGGGGISRGGDESLQVGPYIGLSGDISFGERNVNLSLDEFAS